MDVEYIDRKTGKKEKEAIYGRWALALLYGDFFLARLFSFLFLPWIARIPLFSKWYGKAQQKSSSKKKIAPFMEAFHVDSTEFEELDFATFNDFFIRKLKKEKRPIAEGDDVAILPADGRYLVFPNLSTTDHFYVKGQRFHLSSLLKDEVLAQKYENGSMVIARLCPSDYHRFHFPVDGIASPARFIEGPLFSVNPLALRKRLSILWENRRMITQIETEKFGKIQYIEVGATCVGTIHQTYLPDHLVRKGDEKGYFSFGGSCCILLFEKDKILLDQDLVEYSKKGYEVKAFFGMSMGKSTL